VLILDSNQSGKTPYVRGRDVDEKETALLFNGGFWTILGEASDDRRSSERNRIASSTGMSGTNVRRLLTNLA